MKYEKEGVEFYLCLIPITHLLFFFKEFFESLCKKMRFTGVLGHSPIDTLNLSPITSSLSY